MDEKQFLEANITLRELEISQKSTDSDKLISSYHLQGRPILSNDKF
jgi:hypothetical protein